MHKIRQKVRKKVFFPNYRGGHGPFWPGGGYAHGKMSFSVTLKLTNSFESD